MITGQGEFEMINRNWRRWAAAINLDRVLRRWLGGRGIILMLHRVQASSAVWRGDPGLWITLDQLQAIIEILPEQGYEFIPLSAALPRLTGRQTRRFACLTFDDGYRDNYELALPLLRSMGIPATIYVTTGLVDGRVIAWWHLLEVILNQHSELNLQLADHRYRFPAISLAQKCAAYHQASALLRAAAPAICAAALQQLAQDYGLAATQLSQSEMLTDDMVRSLAADSQFELGAHTVSHPVLSALPPAMAQAEIALSKQWLETLGGRPIRHFAYPYGDRAAVTPAVQAQVEACGFTTATIAYGGPVTTNSDPYALPRIPFGGQDTVWDLRFRTSGARNLQKCNGSLSVRLT
jgi:peptidoglycan/xylan/chitin deacetylase (PgdA/CDA1 family)